MRDEKKDIEMERAIFHLEQKIKFNERLRCPRVAARYRRELERLVNEKNGQNERIIEKKDRLFH